MTLRVQYYIAYPNGMGADRWIYDGWRAAFEDLGHPFTTLSNEDDWVANTADFRPDVLFITNFIDLERRQDELRRIRKMGTKVFLISDWPMAPRDIEIMASGDVADVFMGEREESSMKAFEATTGKRYHLIPNAANKLLHFPTQPVEKYAYDVVYLGANLPKKRAFFDRVLTPIRRRYRVGLFGPGWTVRDNALRAGQKAFRNLGWYRAADALNARRLTVPIDEENALYSSAKICLNFHEREPDGSQPHLIVNQRAFKIPACGGFQLCDDVSVLPRYFASDEIAVAKDPDDWLAKVEHFLAHDDERRAIQQKGTERALRDHTYHNRVQQVVALAEQA